MDLETSRQFIEQQWNIQPETIEVIDEQQGLWFVKRASGRLLLARDHYSLPVSEQDMDTITAWWLSKKNETSISSLVRYVTPRGSDAIQRFNDLLLQYNPLSVVVGRREIVVTWKQEEDEKRFQAAWKALLEPVKLYEDNIGNLYLHQQGSSLVYQVPLPSASSFFENDCQDIASGDTANWNEELVHGYAEMQDTLRPPSTEHIATWYPDKPYELHQQPGEAGRRYLQLPTEE